ncbi:YfgM family protein [Larsenimonas salina]|uniref:YfgM family protein n=1 Tax=Larsenimonas salina TaxID=1295565 RepID=UPI002073A2A3|nr:tetratricopeptide repeat protein [Larsenimonas salina]
MADELRSEEDQVDAIKRWWKSSGSSILVGAVLAGIAVFGWKYWQDHQERQAAEASSRYQQLIQLVSQNQTIDGQTRTQVNELIDTIEQKDGDTLYANLATLIQARLAVQDGSMDSARNILSGLIERNQDAYIERVARINLARLQLGEGAPKDALSTLSSLSDGPLSGYAEAVRGDAHQALGQDQQALKAYKAAQQHAQQSDLPIFGLQLKIDDLAPEETP